MTDRSSRRDGPKLVPTSIRCIEGRFFTSAELERLAFKGDADVANVELRAAQNEMTERVAKLARQILRMLDPEHFRYPLDWKSEFDNFERDLSIPEITAKDLSE